jgi:hypothetical protein
LGVEHDADHATAVPALCPTLMFTRLVLAPW